MTDPNNGQEPSMEDILASIRRIIDEDDRKAAAPAPVSPPPSAGEDDDVLDLTDEIEETQPIEEIEEIADEGPEEPAESDVGHEIWNADDEVLPQEGADIGVEAEPLELSEPVAPETDAPAEPWAPQEPAISQSQESTMTTGSNDRLVSDAAVSSAAAALGNLARASERDPMAGVPHGRPVEDLVLELLRPMLREWLDEHLPTVVERIVEREVRYLSRRMGGDDGA